MPGTETIQKDNSCHDGKAPHSTQKDYHLDVNALASLIPFEGSDGKDRTVEETNLEQEPVEADNGKGEVL